MDQIYGNSFLTIAAGVSPDVRQGIFHVRSMPKLVQLYHKSQVSFEYLTALEVGSKSLRADQRADPLNQRSWALQERILSKRLLIYSSEQLLWKCLEKQYHEDGSEHHHSEFVRQNYEDTSFYNKDNNWRRIVMRYSQTQAIIETDKFPALSGLVKAMQKERGDE